MEVQVLNAEQAAEFLGVSRRWLMRDGIHEHGIPYLRPGPRKTLFYERDRAGKALWNRDLQRGR